MARNLKTVGAAGEQAAAHYLEAHGYRLVDVNIRPEGGRARGEIDLIAWHGEYLVFVEVKTRRVAQGAQGTPAESINPRKQRQLIALAAAYLAKHSLNDIPCRFDVIEIIEGHDGFARFHLLPNAFGTPD